MATKTVHGYYRFTDIFFEWSFVLGCIDDVRQFKAFIAYDCLVHPDHPLSIGNEKGGIELYQGTFPNGEIRLMFTSAQVEYIRYWLDTMKLTTQPLPLPSSEYLIVTSDLVHTSPVIYRNGAELKKAVKNMDKSNKKLRGVSSLLSNRRLDFEKARVFLGEKRGAWCAIDFESWDRDHTILQEFGYSFVQWKDGKKIEEQGHLIIKEHRHYYNTYVPNHRDNYNFGKSQDVDKAGFKRKIKQLILELSADQPLFLVFHDYRQDIKSLKSHDVQAPLDNISPILPEVPPKSGIFIVDTAELFCALEGEGKNNKRGLSRVCALLGIQTNYLHNAGNDAHYTLLAALEMVSGDPVDMQREKRWPNRTESAGPSGQGVKVRFKEDEEYSDGSDLEGVMAGGGYDPISGLWRE